MFGLKISGHREQIFRLDNEIVTLGRSPACVVPIRGDENISRIHCALFRKKDGAYYLRDLGSPKKTRVNGAVIAGKHLKPGDKIIIGKTKVCYLELESGPFDEVKTLPIVDQKIDIDSSDATMDELQSHQMMIPTEQLTVDQLEFFVNVTERMATDDVGISMFEEIIQNIEDFFPVNRGYLAMLEKGSKEMKVIFERNFFNNNETPGLSRSIYERLVLGEAVVVDEPPWDEISNVKIGSLLAAPIIISNGVWGLVYFDNLNETHVFDDDMVQLVKMLCRFIAMAIEFGIVIQKVEASSDVPEESFEPAASFVGATESVRDLLMQVERFAATDLTVLVTGETGVGKEILSKRIHNSSPRRPKPFMDINCASIPPDLLESELFGYKKGAFTGAAKDRDGLLVRANGGTVFLDEIANMPVSIQSKLLRVLQEKEVRPLGASKSIPIDVRIVAATNKNLEEEVREGRFLVDLFYRINVFPIYIPAMRDRPLDIPLLAVYIFDRAKEQIPSIKPQDISPEAMLKLVTYKWPGNVREMENVIVRSAVMSPHSRLLPEDIHFGDDPAEPEAAVASPTKSLDEATRDYVSQVLLTYDWNMKKVVEVLDIPRSTLYKKIKAWDLKKE